MDEDLSTVYVAGSVTVAPEGFENGTSSETAYIDVEVPTAGLKADELEIDGGTATVPIQITGMDMDKITAGDISFESGAQVTDVQKDGDRLLVTVKADDPDDLAGQITIGEDTYNSGIVHASFYPFFDFIMQNGDNIELSLILQVSAGTVSDSISPEMVTLSEDFEGGTALSIGKTGDLTAELIISVPANGQTDEDYSFSGTVTLAEGALVDRWGGAAPEYSYTRYYAPEELGRDTVTSVIDYTAKGLEFVGVDAKEVAGYGKNTYNLIKSAYKLDLGGVYSSVKEILTLAGVFSGGEDVLTPNKTTDQKVDELRVLLLEMDKKIDKALELQYEDLLQKYNLDIKNLASDSVSAQQKIDKAMMILRERGIEIPGENASDDELVEFNAKLVKLMEDEEKAGNGDFKGYTKLMERLDDEYMAVTAALTNERECNPIYYYDTKLSMYFNRESQGWYLRQAYRTNAEFQVKRAYDLFSIYYQIPKYPDTHTEIIARYADSLSRVEEIAPGYPSWRGYPGNGVYSPSLKITVYECERCFYPTRSAMAITGANVSDERAKEYVARLSGRTVKEDLRLARLNNWTDAGKALDGTGHVKKTWDDDDTKTNPNHKNMKITIWRP